MTEKNSEGLRKQYDRSGRHPQDDYPTPAGFVDALVGLGRVDPAATVWDPCAGSGWLVRRLRERGFSDVLFDDLRYNDRDFLVQEPREGVDWVVTNPPFKHAEEFVRRSLALAGQGVAFLLSNGFLESVGRAEGLFSEHPPALVALNYRKMRLADGRSSVFSHVWVLWTKDHQGPTEYTWVNPGKDSKERTIPTGEAGVWENNTVDWSLL